MLQFCLEYAAKVGEPRPGIYAAVRTQFAPLVTTGLPNQVKEAYETPANRADPFAPRFWEARLLIQRVFDVRVFVDLDRTPAGVVTAYRTSKITKYWRPDV